VAATIWGSIEISPIVRDQESPLASGAISCVSKNRDRSAEGTVICCIAPMGFLFM
jgi:hypothetical protein